MGERKLRFDTRKNDERKKRAERVVVNPELKISLPLSIYLSNAVSDSNSLRIRLERTVIASAKAIPDGWTLSSQVDVTCSFTLTKLPFILKVYSDCTWCVVVGTDHVDCQYSEALKNVVSTLTCLKDIIDLLQVLNNCSLCCGIKILSLMVLENNIKEYSKTSQV